MTIQNNFIPRVKQFTCEIITWLYDYHKDNESLNFLFKTSHDADTKEFELEFLKIILNCLLIWIELSNNPSLTTTTTTSTTAYKDHIEHNLAHIDNNRLIQDLHIIITTATMNSSTTTTMAATATTSSITTTTTNHNDMPKPPLSLDTCSSPMEKDILRCYMYATLAKMMLFKDKILKIKDENDFFSSSSSSGALKALEYVNYLGFMSIHFPDEIPNMALCALNIARALTARKFHQTALKFLQNLKEKFIGLIPVGMKDNRIEDLVMKMLFFCEINTGNTDNLTRICESLNTTSKNQANELLKFAIEIKRKFDLNSPNNPEVTMLVLEKKFEMLLIDYNLEENDAISIFNEFYLRKEYDTLLHFIMLFLEQKMMKERKAKYAFDLVIVYFSQILEEIIEKVFITNNDNNQPSQSISSSQQNQHLQITTSSFQQQPSSLINPKKPASTSKDSNMLTKLQDKINKIIEYVIKYLIKANITQKRLLYIQSRIIKYTIYLSSIQRYSQSNQLLDKLIIIINKSSKDILKEIMILQFNNYYHLKKYELIHDVYVSYIQYESNHDKFIYKLIKLKYFILRKFALKTGNIDQNTTTTTLTTPKTTAPILKKPLKVKKIQHKPINNPKKLDFQADQVNNNTNQKHQKKEHKDLIEPKEAEEAEELEEEEEAEEGIIEEILEKKEDIKEILSIMLSDIINTEDYDIEYFLYYIIIDIIHLEKDISNANTTKNLSRLIFTLFMTYIKDNMETFYGYFMKKAEKNKVKNLTVTILQIFSCFLMQKFPMFVKNNDNDQLPHKDDIINKGMIIELLEIGFLILEIFRIFYEHELIKHVNNKESNESNEGHNLPSPSNSLNIIGNNKDFQFIQTIFWNATVLIGHSNLDLVVASKFLFLSLKIKFIRFCFRNHEELFKNGMKVYEEEGDILDLDMIFLARFIKNVLANISDIERISLAKSIILYLQNINCQIKQNTSVLSNVQEDQICSLYQLIKDICNMNTSNQDNQTKLQGLLHYAFNIEFEYLILNAINTPTHDNKAQLYVEELFNKGDLNPNIFLIFSETAKALHRKKEMTIALRAYLKLNLRKNIRIHDIALDIYSELIENAESIEEEALYLRQIKIYFENLIEYELSEEEKLILISETKYLFSILAKSKAKTERIPTDFTRQSCLLIEAILSYTQKILDPETYKNIKILMDKRKF